MGRTRCKCDFVISDNEESNVYYLISSKELDRCFDVSNALENDLTELNQVSDNISKYAISVLKCPECGRLIIFEDDNSIYGTSYIREED